MYPYNLSLHRCVESEFGWRRHKRHFLLQQLFCSAVLGQLLADSAAAGGFSCRWPGLALRQQARSELDRFREASLPERDS